MIFIEIVFAPPAPNRMPSSDSRASLCFDPDYDEDDCEHLSDTIVSDFISFIIFSFVSFTRFSQFQIDNLTESEPTSAILSFCQRKFLLPYVNLLGLVGLRPITIDSTECTTCMSHLQTIFVVTMLIAGYVIQYVTNFR